MRRPNGAREGVREGGFTFLMELEGGGEGRGGPDEGVFGVQMKGRGGVYRCPNKGKGEGVPVSKWDKKKDGLALPMERRGGGCRMSK